MTTNKEFGRTQFVESKMDRSAYLRSGNESGAAIEKDFQITVVHLQKNAGLSCSF